MVALQSNLSRDEQLAAIADIEAFQASRPDDCDQELSTRVKEMIQDELDPYATSKAKTVSDINSFKSIDDYVNAGLYHIDNQRATIGGAGDDDSGKRTHRFSRSSSPHFSTKTTQEQELKTQIKKNKDDIAYLESLIKETSPAGMI